MENGYKRFITAVEDSEEFQLLMAYASRRNIVRAFASKSIILIKEKGVVDTVARIVDSLHIAPSDIEPDCQETDVIQTIVELLRESGDHLNEEMKKKNNKTLFQKLQNFNYADFAQVTKLFVECTEPSSTSDSEERERAKIALTFEVTCRLTAVQNHPMNLLMGFGARYLQEHFSTWAQRHGGWEKAFDIEDNDEVQ